MEDLGKIVSVGTRVSGRTNIFDEYPDKWDEVDGVPFPQLGFTFGWETLPFGINGGFYFAKLNIDF